MHVTNRLLWNSLVGRPRCIASDAIIKRSAKYNCHSPAAVSLNELNYPFSLCSPNKNCIKYYFCWAYGHMQASPSGFTGSLWTNKNKYSSILLRVSKRPFEHSVTFCPRHFVTLKCDDSTLRSLKKVIWIDMHDELQLLMSYQ